MFSFSHSFFRFACRLSGRISYAYDPQGRMVSKKVSGPTSNQQLETRNYLWDNWNIISEAVTDHPSLTTNHCYYVWGIDLSGTLQGAGGVGGLLAVIKDDNIYAPTYDANGNVSEYVSLADGSIAAHYEYDPFGNIVIQAGDLADDFTFRFSTKPFCPITGIVHYEMRPDRPDTGRWLSRDPIGEQGGKNLYGFAENNPINKYDRLGYLAAPWDRVPPFKQEPPWVILFPPDIKPLPFPWSDIFISDPLHNPSSGGLSYSGCECCLGIKDAVQKVNDALGKGSCKKWFTDHGHDFSSGKPSRSIACHGNWKILCLLGFPAWTMPGARIGVCNSKCEELGSDALASLLIHELAHHYCTPFRGREDCAISAQDACYDALIGQ